MCTVVRCDHLLPSGHVPPVLHHNESEGTDFRECLLRSGHAGPHLIRTSRGRFVQWEIDEDCECEACQEADEEGDSSSRCMTHGDISEAAAQKRIAEQA